MTKLPVSSQEIADFCQRWRVTEFAIFGSILRDDFRPDSDVDVLLTFAPQSRWTLFDMVDMQEELQTIFGRSVDLLTKSGVENSRNEARKEEILTTAEVLYVS